MTQPENTTPGALPQSVAEESSTQPANEALRRIFKEQDEQRERDAEGGEQPTGGQQEATEKPAARRAAARDGE
jgi:hypothetical protein